MDIVRSTKPGSKWTTNELAAYNISIVDVDDITFFGLSLDSVDLSDIPQGMLKPKPDDRESQMLFNYLELALDIHEAEESAVDDYAVKLLEMLGYSDTRHSIRTRKDIQFIMCGEYTHAKTDVCVMTKERILLLLQEDKSHINPTDPEAQIVAEAIAAFQHNNAKRRAIPRGSEVDIYTFPCITMVGSYPIFYKITVSKHLSDAVAFGTYPSETTFVHRFQLTYERDAMIMKDLTYRTIILKCFKALKSLVAYNGNNSA